MLVFIDFLRDNWYWFIAAIVGFMAFCVLCYRKDIKNRASNTVNIYEKSYFGESDVVAVDQNDFHLADKEFYSRVEKELSENGFTLIGDFRESLHEEISPNSFCFSRAMRNDDGSIAAFFYHFVTTDQSGNVTFNEYRIDINTYFVDDTNISTVPLKYKDEYFKMKNILIDFPDIEDISELVNYHKERVEKYISENPENEIKMIIAFNDVANTIIREREIKRDKIIAEKCCLISYSDFQKMLSFGNINIKPDDLWQAIVKEQKRRGYWYLDDDGRNIILEESELVAEVESESSDEPEVAALTETEDVTGLKDRLDSIAEQVEQAQLKKPNPMNGLITLVVSLFIFFSLGWFKWSLDFVFYIIVVLFIHEMGHYLAMRLFGYRNLKMFFIPLLGAAVSGHGHNVATYKKVLVSLAGPLPGIILGLVLVWYSLAYNNELCRKLAFMMLFLNGFNLLPFLPLDGGWVMHHTLYSRFPILEVGMRIIAACLFGFVAFRTNDFIFYLLAFVNFAGVSRAYKDSKFVKQAKIEMAESGEAEMESHGGRLVEIPRQWLGKLDEYICDTRKTQAHDTIATEALGLWDRIATRPTGVFATLGLWLLTFIVGWCSLIAGGAASAGFFEPMLTKTEIVEYEREDGEIGIKLLSYCYNNRDNVHREIELTDDGKLYHGRHRKYWRGELVWEGQWDNGLKVGEWKRYWFGDHDEKLYYEDGILVSEKYKDEFGNWGDAGAVEKDKEIVDVDSEEGELAEVEVTDEIVEDDEIEVMPEGPDAEVLERWRHSRGSGNEG